jgi:hypothetical protein
MREIVVRLDTARVALAGVAFHLGIAPKPGSVDITDRKPSRRSVNIVKADVANALVLCHSLIFG